MMKQCTKCYEEKDEEDFYPYYKYCKKCKHKQSSEARRKRVNNNKIELPEAQVVNLGKSKVQAGHLKLINIEQISENKIFENKMDLMMFKLDLLIKHLNIHNDEKARANPIS